MVPDPSEQAFCTVCAIPFSAPITLASGTSREWTAFHHFYLHRLNSNQQEIQFIFENLLRISGVKLRFDSSSNRAEVHFLMANIDPFTLNNHNSKSTFIEVAFPQRESLSHRFFPPQIKWRMWWENGHSTICPHFSKKFEAGIYNKLFLLLRLAGAHPVLFISPCPFLVSDAVALRPVWSALGAICLLWRICVSQACYLDDTHTDAHMVDMYKLTMWSE